MERNKKRRWIYRRALGILVAVLLLLGISTGGTLAYLVATNEPITRQFTTANMAVEVEENGNGNTKTEIVIRNTGNTAVYVRVALTADMTDTKGNLSLDAYMNLNSLNSGSGWVKHMDGYYYYTAPVRASDVTGNLLGASLTLNEGQNVKVLAQCVQAEPTDAVVEAWGVNPSSLGGGN